MRILVFGAAAIGTLYAARLQEVWHRETILAPSLRLADIRLYDLVLGDIVSGARSITRGGVTDQLSAEDAYDMALITVRRDQLTSIHPDLN
jgi:2-dehydropantoate 2-reductase